MPVNKAIVTGHQDRGLEINDVTVVREQGATISAVTPAADGTAAGTTLNLLLAEMRRHGLIAT